MGVTIMKKILTLLLSATLTLGILAGCSVEETPETPGGQTPEETPAGEEDDKVVIYGIYKAGDQTWFIDEGNAAKAKAESMGAEFVYVDAKMNPEEALKAVDNAIANKADGILICIPDQTMSQAVVDKANDAGIPIIGVDDALEVSGEKIAPWVGIDGYVIGEANGEFMANYVMENNMVDDPEVAVMILTMDTVSSVVPRTEGAYDKFTSVATSFDTAKIYKADTDGTTEKGNTAATALITAHPEVKKWIVMSGNEETAIGAVRALETAGLDGGSAVIGLGGYLAKDEWNTKGDDVAIKAAAYFSADSIGGASAEMLINFIKNGTEIPKSTAVPAIVVTPENYKEVMGAAAE